jgi:hypothetical protein
MATPLSSIATLFYPESSLDKICKQAEELWTKYNTFEKYDPEVLTKISSELNNLSNPEEELIKTSQEFRTIFKEAALKDGQSEAYVRGVFETAEQICKQATIPGELAEGAEQLAAPALKRVLREALPTWHSQGSGAGLYKTPIQGPAPYVPKVAPQNIPRPKLGPQPTPSPAPVGSGPTVPIRAPTATATPAQTQPGNQPGLWDRMTGRNVGPDWWKGKGWKSVGKGTMTGATIGGLGGLPFGMGIPGTIAGGVAGAGAGAIRGMGARGLALGAAGLGAAGLGAKALGSSGIPQNVASGTFDGVKQNIGGQTPSDDFIPGISNGITGSVGGALLASMLAKNYGLTGMPGLAAMLLGGYGGYKYLPQLLSSLKNGNGFNSSNTNQGDGSITPPTTTGYFTGGNY